MDEWVEEFNHPSFIVEDPIAIPHRYSQKEDIEIAGFLAATIAWGNRKSIVKDGHQMLDLLGESPYDFVLSATDEQIERLRFTHRTFNSADLQYFIRALRHIDQNYGGMHGIFERYAEPYGLQAAISHFKRHFFELPHQQRTEKHVADPLSGSSAKRINMMLRWFVRKDEKGVDFGIWSKSIKPSQLSIPLDVHTGKVSRALGLLSRKQNDAKAVAELDAVLRMFKPEDPVIYDYALFSLGVHNKGF